MDCEGTGKALPEMSISNPTMSNALVLYKNDSSSEKRVILPTPELPPRPANGLSQVSVRDLSMSDPLDVPIPLAVDESFASSNMKANLATLGVPSRHGKDVAEVHISVPSHVDLTRNEQMRSMSETANLDGMQLRDEKLQLMDPKRVKRLLSNRKSAERHREKSVKRCAELESEVSKLQEHRGMTKYIIDFHLKGRKNLLQENYALKEKLARAEEAQTHKIEKYNMLQRQKRMLLDLQKLQKQQRANLQQHPSWGNQHGNIANNAIVPYRPVTVDDRENRLQLTNHEEQKPIISNENINAENQNQDAPELEGLTNDKEGVLKGGSFWDPVEID